MSKIILFIFLIINIFYAKEINFTQTKYINALDSSFKKYGFIKISKNELILKYSNEDKIIHFKEDNILILNKGKEEILEYDKNIKLQIFYKLITSIYNNNTSSLENNFKVLKKDDITLVPKEYIKNIIHKIKYKKENEKLKYLDIYFTNKDRISIVQTN